MTAQCSTLNHIQLVKCIVYGSAYNHIQHPILLGPGLVIDIVGCSAVVSPQLTFGELACWEWEIIHHFITCDRMLSFHAGTDEFVVHLFIMLFLDQGF